MTNAGYSRTVATWGNGEVHKVTSPEGNEYSTDAGTENRPAWCTCPFHNENRHLKGTVCKHTLWLKAELEWEDGACKELDQLAEEDRFTWEAEAGKW